MSERMNGRIDPRPVRPGKLNLLDGAIVRTDGTRVPGLNPEDGPRIADTYHDIVDFRRQVYSDLQNPEAPPRDGDLNLSSPADFVTNGDGTRVQWTRGFGYRPELCDGSTRIDIFGNSEGTPATPGSATPTFLENEIDVMPFMVEGIDEWAVFGGARPDVLAERQDAAYRQLLACRSKQIEQELWNGTLSVANGWGNRYLADSDCTLPEGDRLLGFITAMSVLEQAINDGSCSLPGMIHCTALTATVWVSAHLARRVGNLLVSELGTIIVPGSGYNGSAPLYAAAPAHTQKMDPAHSRATFSTDSAWAYATTIPEVFLSDVLPEQRMPERLAFETNNDLRTFQRQVAAVTWGCVHAGVHVNHDSDLTVTGS